MFVASNIVLFDDMLLYVDLFLSPKNMMFGFDGLLVVCLCSLLFF